MPQHRLARRAREIARSAGLTFALSAIAWGVSPAQGLAEQEPAQNLIWAARACYLEASFSESDCVALLWVARKRAERSHREWIDLLLEYSTVMAHNDRAELVRSFPWGDVPGRSAVWNRDWKRLRELVVEVASGQHEDPCPRAQHWGGSMDSPHGRMIPARCARATANTFYAVRAWKPRKQASAR